MDLSQRVAGARGFGAGSSQQGQANGEHQAQTHLWSMKQRFAKLHQRDMKEVPRLLNELRTLMAALVGEPTL